MLEQNVQINIEPGLHARPAALFVRVASKFEAKVTVRKGEKEVDGKSLMGLLTLAAKKGEWLKIKGEGRDEEGAVDSLTNLVETDFQE
ncbi:MAG: HPr family phosphocarrier protein [Clostridia bacterium]|nr:HPr family phosphocarrier protein [Clostridia bacterium]